MRWLGLSMGMLGTLQYTLGTKLSVGWDGSVGIATCSELAGLGTKSQSGVDFPHPSTLTLGPT